MSGQMVSILARPKKTLSLTGHAAASGLMAASDEVPPERTAKGTVRRPVRTEDLMI
jgi:hypothetical protein